MILMKIIVKNCINFVDFYLCIVYYNDYFTGIHDTYLLREKKMYLDCSYLVLVINSDNIVKNIEIKR